MSAVVYERTIVKFGVPCEPPPDAPKQCMGWTLHSSRVIEREIPGIGALTAMEVIWSCRVMPEPAAPTDLGGPSLDLFEDSLAVCRALKGATIEVQEAFQRILRATERYK